MIARGFPRATIDIDATVATSVDDVNHLIAFAARLKLVPRIDDASQFARDNLVLLLEHAIFGVPVDVSLALQPFEVDAAKHPERVTFKRFCGARPRSGRQESDRDLWLDELHRGDAPATQTCA